MIAKRDYVFDRVLINCGAPLRLRFSFMIDGKALEVKEFLAVGSIVWPFATPRQVCAGSQYSLDVCFVETVTVQTETRLSVWLIECVS